jgi:hypothetical protein
MSDTAQCGRCKRHVPQRELRRLWRLPLLILRFAHATPGKEGEWRYCRGCARSQNVGVLFLAVMFSCVIAVGGGHVLTYGLLGGWALGLLIWLSLRIRYRIQMAKYVRYVASLPPQDQEQVLAQVSEEERQRIREYVA